MLGKRFTDISFEKYFTKNSKKYYKTKCFKTNLAGDEFGGIKGGGIMPRGAPWGKSGRGLNGSIGGLCGGGPEIKHS